MTQSSNELIFQVTVMARNKRLAERFFVLLRCGLQRRRVFYQNDQPPSGSGFLEIS